MSPMGELRPCYDAIRLQKFMLKFNRLIRDHSRIYSLNRYTSLVESRYGCLFRYICGLYSDERSILEFYRHMEVIRKTLVRF